MKYLITGATGGYGAYALEALAKLVPADEIVVMARNLEKAEPLKTKGYEVRLGDYSDLNSLKSAFTGIDRLLFVSGAPGNRQAEHKNVITAAKAAGVSYIIYTSAPKVGEVTGSLSADHLFTEQLIIASGISHTFLRNNMYLENELPIVKGALDSGKFIYHTATGKTGWALKREYAEAGAKVLVAGNFNEILELSGQPVTYAELAEALKIATNKDFEVIVADEAGFTENLIAAGLPDFVADMFLAIQKDIENGAMDVNSNDFEKVLGHTLTSLPEALKELL